MCHNYYNLIRLVWINWYIDIVFGIGIKIIKIIKILIFSKELNGIQHLFFVFDKRLNFALLGKQHNRFYMYDRARFNNRT